MQLGLIQHCFIIEDLHAFSAGHVNKVLKPQSHLLPWPAVIPAWSCQLGKDYILSYKANASIGLMIHHKIYSSQAKWMLLGI